MIWELKLRVWSCHIFRIYWKYILTRKKRLLYGKCQSVALVLSKRTVFGQNELQCRLCAYSLKSDFHCWTTMRFSLEWMNVFNMSVCVIYPKRFMLWFPLSVSLCHCSFGTQRGGRRGSECITLEPSEMIVVSGNLYTHPSRLLGPDWLKQTSNHNMLS